MKIETRFKVGDIVQEINSKDLTLKKTALRIVQLMTETCYVGTQIFYYYRSIHLEKFNDEWAVFFEKGTGDYKIGWNKIREDELKQCDFETLKIINGED